MRGDQSRLPDVRRYLLLTAVVVIAGCGSFGSKMNTWVGSPFERHLDVSDTRTRIEEKRGPDDRGHVTYVERIQNGENCRVIWDVDAQGLITGWRSEGSACKWYTN